MVALLALAGVTVRSLGLEFLPKLEEGNLWIRATLPSTISIDAGNEYVNRMRTLIRSFPEVEAVVSQHGRPDDGTDAAGSFNAEFFAPLKPVSEWPAGMDKDKLTAEMLAKLRGRLPRRRVQLLAISPGQRRRGGVRRQRREFDQAVRQRPAGADRYRQQDQRRAGAPCQGVTDLAVFTSLGQPTVQIDIDRARAARVGLTPGDINATIQAAIGGQSAGDVYEPGSDRHFPIVVRLAPQFRQDVEAIKNLRVVAQGPNGIAQIPLNQVANVNLVTGASYIYREGQQRYLPIKFSVRDRDLGSAIKEAQRKVAEQVPLPPGSALEWVGEFGNLQDAIARLQVVVPITLALIALLLWINFGSVPDTLLAMSVIPMALLGGVFALFVTGVPFSVSAAIGFIALFGISVMDGIIILSQFNQLVQAGMERTARGPAHRRAAAAPGADDLRDRRRRAAAGGAVLGHRLAGAEAAGDRRGRRHDAGAVRDPGHAAGADLAVLAPPSAVVMEEAAAPAE